MVFLLTFDVQISFDSSIEKDKVFTFHITILEHRSLFCLISVERLLVTVASLGPIQVFPCISHQFVNHALGRYDQTLICLAEGQSVQGSATRARLH